jgi:general secretion pathway protein I
MPHKRSQAGFTLIEAVVALVILATALVGFYSFLSTTLNGANHLEQAAIGSDRRLNALELAATLNPMATPDGSFKLDSYRIEWHSKAVTQVQQSSRYPVGQGNFHIALYEVTLNFPDNPAIEPVVVTKLGYHRDGAVNAGLGGAKN